MQISRCAGRAPASTRRSIRCSRSVDGVAVASPVVETDVTVSGRDSALTLVGVDVFRAAAITPALVGATGDRMDALRGDTLFPSAAAASWLGVHDGDTVDVAAGRSTLTLRVAGTSGGSGALRYAVMDIAAVQDAFGLRGRLTRIDLRASPGTDVGKLAQRVQALLPPGLVAHRRRPAWRPPRGCRARIA